MVPWKQMDSIGIQILPNGAMRLYLLVHVLEFDSHPALSSLYLLPRFVFIPSLIYHHPLGLFSHP